MTTPLLEQDGVAPASHRDAVWSAELADDLVMEQLHSYQWAGGFEFLVPEIPSDLSVGQGDKIIQKPIDNFRVWPKITIRLVVNRNALWRRELHVGQMAFLFRYNNDTLSRY